MRTNSLWVLGALVSAGGIASLTFVGCSSSSDSSSPPAADDTGTTVVDTGSAAETANDTGVLPGDSAVDSATDAPDDTAPSGADRKISVVFASPDSPPYFICLGIAGGDPTSPTFKPIQTTQTDTPIGIPDSADPNNVSKFQPFKFGSVFPFPVDIPQIQAALDSGIRAIAWLTTDTPVAHGCGATWSAAQSAKNYVVVPPKTVKKGESWLLAVTGCHGSGSAAGECGAGSNFEFLTQKLDVTDPTTFAGGGSGPKVGVQFFELSQVFTATPGWDFSIQPMNAGTGGGAPTPAGTAIALTPTGAGVAYKYFADKAIGVQIGGDPTEALLIAQAHGVPACTPGSTGCQTTLAIPLKPFLAAYAPIGGGWTGNQVLIPMGTPRDATKFSVALLPSKF